MSFLPLCYFILFYVIFPGFSWEFSPSPITIAIRVEHENSEYE